MDLEKLDPNLHPSLYKNPFLRPRRRHVSSSPRSSPPRSPAGPRGAGGDGSAAGAGGEGDKPPNPGRRSPSPRPGPGRRSPRLDSRRRRRQTRSRSPLSPSPRRSSPPSRHGYFTNRTITSVWDLWREWTVGLGNGPAVSELNETYGSGWRIGWLAKERQYYSQRLVIIDHIHRRAGPNAGARLLEDAAKRLDTERGKTSLNALAKKMKKALKETQMAV